jgi:hypothetical protein
VHATGGNLHHANLVGSEVGVETRSLYVDAVLRRAQAELTGRAFAEDVDIQALCRRLVDDGGLGEDFGLLCRIGGGTSLALVLALGAIVSREC